MSTGLVYLRYNNGLNEQEETFRINRRADRWENQDETLGADVLLKNVFYVHCPQVKFKVTSINGSMS